MSLEKFISIASITIGFIGSVIVGIGVFKMTPNLMVNLSSTYWDFSLPTLESLAGQKAELLCGMVLLAIAFVMQLFVTVIPHMDRVTIFASYGAGICFAFVLALLVSG